MRENCTSGSVEGASGNGRSYSVMCGKKMYSALIVSLLMCASSVSFACSCSGGSISGAIKGGAPMFWGTVVEIEDSERYGFLKVKFQIIENYNNEFTSPVHVYTADDEFACGYPFEKGSEYLVFPYIARRTSEDGVEGALQVSFCGNTVKVNEKLRSEFESGEKSLYEIFKRSTKLKINKITGKIELF